MATGSTKNTENTEKYLLLQAGLDYPWQKHPGEWTRNGEVNARYVPVLVAPSGTMDGFFITCSSVDSVACF